MTRLTGIACLFVLGSACGLQGPQSGEEDGSAGAGAGTGSGDPSSTSSLGGPSSGSGASDNCAEVTETADTGPQPSDIIIAVDQSGSMDVETSFVQSQINGFASQIIQSGIDVHVVVIAGRPQSSDNGFCVPSPLGSGSCPADDNLPTFLHVDNHVGSHNALHLILEKFPEYSQALRPNSARHVVVISDDNAHDITAQQFDQQLKALDAPHFDNYVFHAIVSNEKADFFDCEFLGSNSPCCGYSADEGHVYKELINMTQGVFGDLCMQNFQPVWDSVSTEVIASTTLACEWDIPAPPDGQVFDANRVNVDLGTNGSPPSPLGYVDAASACSGVGNAWYYDNASAPTKIYVCPQTCTTIQAASDAQVNIKFGCATEIANPK